MRHVKGANVTDGQKTISRHENQKTLHCLADILYPILLLRSDGIITSLVHIMPVLFLHHMKGYIAAA